MRVGVDLVGAVQELSEHVGQLYRFAQQVSGTVDQVGLDPVIITERLSGLPQVDVLRQIAEENGFGVVTFPAFLRTFLDAAALQRRLRDSVDAVAYVKPSVLIGTDELPIDRFVSDLLVNPFTPRLVVIHAPGGRGKTTLCEYVAAELLRQQGRADPYSTQARPPLPFLIRFGDVKGVTAITPLLHETLRSYGWELDLTPDAVDRLIRYGVLMLIFDGFDELSEKAGDRLNVGNISHLAQSMHRRTAGHAILSCRTTFLATHALVLEELQQQSEQTLLLGELLPFTDAQVDRFLESHAPEGERPDRHRARVREYIRTRDRITESAREPLILRTLSEVIGDSPFTLPEGMANVYWELVERACEREVLRQDLPPDLPQIDFLGAVAEFVATPGEYAIDQEFFGMVAEDELASFVALHGVDEEERASLVIKLKGHYMFMPQTLEADAPIQFRHPSFRDFLLAVRLRRSLSGTIAVSFQRGFAASELPDGALRFLAELLEPDSVERLSELAGVVDDRFVCNLARLASIWEGGLHFRKIFAPPISLRGKNLSNITFEDVDLTGYVWRGTAIDRVLFRNCDLREADLGPAMWRELHFQGCSLEGVKLGDPPVWPKITVDGQVIKPENAEEILSAVGMAGLGIGVKEVAPPEDPIPLLLREIFAKVVEGNRREDTRLTRKKPSSFERGRYCADNADFVRTVVLPELQKTGFLEPSGDRHSTLTVRRRLGEVVDFLFDERASRDLMGVMESLRSQHGGNRTGP